MLTESEIKSYTVDIPNDIQKLKSQKASGSAWCEHVKMGRDQPISQPKRYVLMIRRPHGCWAYVERWWKFCQCVVQKENAG